MDSTDAPERAGRSASAISGASTPKRLEEGPAQKMDRSHGFYHPYIITIRWKTLRNSWEFLLNNVDEIFVLHTLIYFHEILFKWYLWYIYIYEKSITQTISVGDIFVRPTVVESIDSRRLGAGTISEAPRPLWCERWLTDKSPSNQRS